MECLAAWIHAVASTVTLVAILFAARLISRARRNVSVIAEDHERRIRQLESASR